MLRSRALSACTRLFNALWRGVSKHEGHHADPSLETRPSCCGARPHPSRRRFAPPQDEGGARAMPPARERRARVRGSSLSRVRHSYSLVKQHMFLRSRGAFLRPGFAFFASRTRMRGGGAPRKRSGARAPVGRALTRHARRLARRLASLGRRSPLGAPPWRFWAPVPRFPHRQLSLACASASNRIGHSELLASGS